VDDRATVAVIGAGKVAGGFDEARRGSREAGVFTHAGAYAKSGKFKIETVFDVDRDRAAGFQRYWGAGKTADAFEDICNSHHDVVSVCTPDASHYAILTQLLETGCCRSIFVEKPLALEIEQIRSIDELARRRAVPVIVNFQRRFDARLARVRDRLRAGRSLLTANAYYIKGLEHIGVTMVDTITWLLGYPQSVVAYNKVQNAEIGEGSYEFVLFYADFNATIKTADSRKYPYSYHIFELDLLTHDERITINDSSRQLEIRGLTDFAYPGVKVLDDRSPVRVETELNMSMLHAVNYVHEVTAKGRPHVVNTPGQSCNNKVIVDKVKQSFQTGCKLEFAEDAWIS
jgi:predicted dehydrogenase